MMFRLCCVVVHITRLPDENADMCAITSLYSSLSVHLHILSMLVPVSPGETHHAPVPYHHHSLGGIRCRGASSRFPNNFLFLGFFRLILTWNSKVVVLHIIVR